MWTFLLSHWEFPRKRRVNSHLWEGGHFHKNKGKALKQRREEASCRVHFSKNSQVYLDSLLVRVTSKITFMRDFVWNVLIVILILLKLTFKKNIVLHFTKTNERSYGFSMKMDMRCRSPDFTLSFCQDPRFIIVMIKPRAWLVLKKAHGVMIRWRQERVKFCKSRVIRTDVIFIKVSVTQ